MMKSNKATIPQGKKGKLVRGNGIMSIRQQDLNPQKESKSRKGEEFKTDYQKLDKVVKVALGATEFTKESLRDCQTQDQIPIEELVRKELSELSILEKAIEIVGPAKRGLDYGHPLDNFEMEAEFMNVWWKFKHKLNRPSNKNINGPFDWKDMAVHKILMKLVRECHRHKEDNSIDIAGYAWTLEEAIIERAKRYPNEQ